jgi:transcriptional regulator with XRE-family HTH domain
LRNLTQEELAYQTGISPAHIANIEKGRKGVSLEVLRLICKKLGVSVTDVLPDEGHKEDLRLRERLIAETISVMNGLDTEKLGLVKTMVGALRD